MYDAGEVFISLSKSKCVAGLKSGTAEDRKDREVFFDLAAILCAGLVSEQLASQRNGNLSPNSKCAIPDQKLARQQLGEANLSKKLEVHEKVEKAARDLLQLKWQEVEHLAEFLFEVTSAQPDEILNVIEGSKH